MNCPHFTTVYALINYLLGSTENPRVENSVITSVSMHPEGSDLIEAFFMPDGFVLRGYSCLLFESTDLF